MRGGFTRNVPPNERKLIEPRVITINGRAVTVGACCKCGRSLRQSHANKTGVRCYYEGAQYNLQGKYLFDARTEKLYKAAQKADKAVKCEPFDDEHDALFKLIEAAKEVCAQ